MLFILVITGGRRRQGWPFICTQTNTDVIESPKPKNRFSPTAWLTLEVDVRLSCAISSPFFQYSNPLEEQSFSHWSGLPIAAQASLKCFWEYPVKVRFCTRVTFLTKAYFMVLVCHIFHLYASEPLVLIPEAYPVTNNLQWFTYSLTDELKYSKRQAKGFLIVIHNQVLQLLHLNSLKPWSS